MKNCAIKKFGLLLVGLITLPSAANANSTFVTGVTTPLTASANLDFTIVIPKYVYVRIGTGTNVANNASVDNIVFTVPAASVGNGTAIAGVGGDLTGGQVTARVLGNNGTIAFSSTTSGALTNATGQTISYAQLGVTVASNTTATALTAPTLVDGGTTSVNLPTQVGGMVTNLDAKWTFAYLNANAVAPGTYGGVNAQNGRVTYAVSMP
jgi:hypothetical protein